MMRLHHTHTSRKDADPLPLINIVFLMLVFFLLAGTIAPTYELDVRPAKAEKILAGELRRPAVYIGRQGEISFGQQKVAPEQLKQMLAAASLDQNVGLRVVADRKADARLLLSVLTSAQSAGISRLFLVTLREGG